MPSIPLQEIVTALMLYIQAELGIVGAIPNPEVEFLPQQEIAAQACEGRCDNILGWFSYEDNVIYLPNSNDFHRNMHDRGVLLHELVHYVQHQRGTLHLRNPCATWKAREVQAYSIQHKWLYENRVPVKTPAYNPLLANFRHMSCAFVPSPSEGAANAPRPPLQ